MRNALKSSKVLALVLAAMIPVLAAAKSAAAAKPASKSAGGNPPAAAQTSAEAQHQAILDTARVRKLYLDGEFDEAIGILEQDLRERHAFNHQDSVFIFKHLGVMYAAKYETREKGKYYMNQLLNTEPTARIMDMYASDMIYMIFKNVQDEFEATRGRLARAEEHVHGNQQTEPEPAESKKNEVKPEKESHTLLWVGATGAVVAAGVGAYFLLSDNSPKTTVRTHDVGN